MASILENVALGNKFDISDTWALKITEHKKCQFLGSSLRELKLEHMHQKRSFVDKELILSGLNARFTLGMKLIF